MAHPKPPSFEGYSGPNFTPVPDQLFDEQLSDLSGAELKVLLYIMRRTFGFKKQSDNISLQQICHGIATKDGAVLDRGTGLSKDSAVRGLKTLEERNIILRIRRRSIQKGDEPTTYALNVVPVSENRTPPGGKIGHPPVRKSDTQETVIQDTDLSNIRVAMPYKEEEEESNPSVPDHTASQGIEPIGSVLMRHRRATPPVEREARQAIESAIREFAREFGDRAPLRSTTTRATNLMAEAHASLPAFISTLYEARAITRDRSHGASAARNRMGYFFAVLEDLLGLKPDRAKQNVPSPAT